MKGADIGDDERDGTRRKPPDTTQHTKNRIYTFKVEACNSYQVEQLLLLLLLEQVERFEHD